MTPEHEISLREAYKAYDLASKARWLAEHGMSPTYDVYVHHNADPASREWQSAARLQHEAEVATAKAAESDALAKLLAKLDAALRVT